MLHFTLGRYFCRYAYAMKLKPFQQATVQRVINAFREPNASGRFLVADEVGLGKTRVAQSVIQMLRSQKGEHLEVFYVCSSLSIIHQNREALVDFLAPSLRRHAQVSVDRLTLLPTNVPTRKAPFTLYTLTPGTLPGVNRTGKAKERAVIWELLCGAISGLSKYTSIEDAFRRDVQSWEGDVLEARAKLSPSLYKSFRRELSQKLGLSATAWRSTIIQAMKAWIAEGSDRELIAHCRLALSRVALNQLSPDLIIFDEFQRFFETLIPGEGDDDPVAREIITHLLRGEAHGGPKVLLLSATPYRLFARWAESPHEHYKQFFELLTFLFGPSHSTDIEALKHDMRIYRDRLQIDPPFSSDVLEVRDCIAERLARVMTRTERPRNELTDHAPDFNAVAAPLEALDIRLFRHLGESTTRERDRVAVPGYWTSIPYPLQMMDNGYALVEHSKAQLLTGEPKEACLSWRKVRRFEQIDHPHPKLRALLNEFPPHFLSLPWMVPTLPWWPLGGPFAADQRRGTSKALVFSRFRAAPRAIAAVLSYEAERYCFSPQEQRSRGSKPIAYEYRTEKGAKPLVGLRRRPSHTFTFSFGSRTETAMRTFLMFAPLPGLAKLGDPLPMAASSKLLRIDQARKIVENKIIKLLGVSGERGRDESIWPWAALIERSSGTHEGLKEGLLSWIREGIQDGGDGNDGQSQGIQSAVERFLDASRPKRPHPTQREVRELAEMALLGPGNVLYRVVDRIFGERKGSGRISSVASTSIEGLRLYFDLPDFHLLFRSRNNHHHGAIRQAVWDGNLESVLDEYLVSLRGLGVVSNDRGVEDKILGIMKKALALGAGGVSVHETGSKRARDPFRMRCHAALPFGLSGQEKETGSGELRNDDLRVAFNSPFRPFVLATTSIGQEGLDFHVWSNHVVHWDLPSNPVDLEQRDGRVNRYGGLAIRRALAENAPCLPSMESPWRVLADGQKETMGGLGPWWIHPRASIRRTVFVTPFSKVAGDLEVLRDQLSIYRLAMGQSDQEALVHALRRRVAAAGKEASRVLSWFEEARIDLSPGHCAPRPNND